MCEENTHSQKMEKRTHRLQLHPLYFGTKRYKKKGPTALLSTPLPLILLSNIQIDACFSCRSYPFPPVFLQVSLSRMLFTFENKKGYGGDFHQQKERKKKFSQKSNKFFSPSHISIGVEIPGCQDYNNCREMRTVFHTTQQSTGCERLHCGLLVVVGQKRRKSCRA